MLNVESPEPVGRDYDDAGDVVQFSVRIPIVSWRRGIDWTPRHYWENKTGRAEDERSAACGRTAVVRGRITGPV